MTILAQPMERPADLGRIGGCLRGGYTAGVETPETRCSSATRSSLEKTGRPPAIAASDLA
jgi:hypothetical protein